MSSGNIWGRKKSVYLGWAKDPVIREKASSGGIITAVCCYLLESGLVDAVIHTKASGKIPYATETVVSVTVEDVLACMGSRYSVSAPLKIFCRLLMQIKGMPLWESRVMSLPCIYT